MCRILSAIIVSHAEQNIIEMKSGNEEKLSKSSIEETQFQRAYHPYSIF